MYAFIANLVAQKDWVPNKLLTSKPNLIDSMKVHL